MEHALQQHQNGSLFLHAFGGDVPNSSLRASMGGSMPRRTIPLAPNDCGNGAKAVEDQRCSSTGPLRADAVRRVRRTGRRHRAGLPWSPREEELLTELYPTHSKEDLALRLGRSQWSILGKARSLRLTRDLGNGCRRPRSEARRWSFDEIGLLRALYPILPYEEVAERIGRSHDAVKMKARKLGLRKVECWTAVEDELLRDSYRDQHLGRIAERLGRTVLAVKARAIVLGLEVKVRHWTPEEIRFLGDSYGVVEWETIATGLGRTRAATAKKAREIGRVRYRRWSREDVRRLTELYPHYTTRAIANRLGHSYEAVRHKVRQWGLRKQAQPAGSTGVRSGG